MTRQDLIEEIAATLLSSFQFLVDSADESPEALDAAAAEIASDLVFFLEEEDCIQTAEVDIDSDNYAAIPDLSGEDIL